MPELLDVLQAGRRKQIGSATEFNRSINADLGGAASPTGMAVNYFDTLYVALTSAQTVAGVKTFSSIPILSGGAISRHSHCGERGGKP
jgi:hypothetical protein